MFELTLDGELFNREIKLPFNGQDNTNTLILIYFSDSPTFPELMEVGTTCQKSVGHGGFIYGMHIADYTI